jgi:hypothetical protein
VNILLNPAPFHFSERRTLLIFISNWLSHLAAERNNDANKCIIHLFIRPAFSLFYCRAHIERLLWKNALLQARGAAAFDIFIIEVSAGAD